MGKSLWKLQDQFSDLKIVCDNGKSVLTAHRAVLAAVCPELKTQLGTTTKFLLPDFSSSEIQLLLKNVYNGCLNSAQKLQVILTQVVALEDSPPSNLEPHTTNLCSLPNEILCHILAYLPTRDVLTNVALVSTRFRDLAKNPSVHQVVRVKNQCTPSLFNFLRLASQMKELYLANWCVDRSIDRLLPFIANHSQLRVFWVDSNIKLTCQTFHLLQSSKWWANLTKLNLFFQFIEDEGFCTLDSLKLCFNEAVARLGSSGTVTHLGAGIDIWSKVAGPAFDKLRSLTLDDCDWKPFDQEALKAIILSRKNTIEDLEIKESYFVRDLDFLSQLPRLATLKIFCWYGSFEVLSKFKQLKSLEIAVWSVDISLPDCYIPLNGLTNLTSLKTGFFIGEEEGPNVGSCYAKKLKKVCDVTKQNGLTIYIIRRLRLFNTVGI